jgi:hypothetical protein
MARRRKPNPDQRALIPALPMDAPAKDAPSGLYVSFVLNGTTLIRYCPTRVYYETMLRLAQTFATDVRGHDPASRSRSGTGDPSARRSAPR